MARERRRTSFTGSAFVRLLARLLGEDFTEPRDALADRLGQWLDWTDAIALSTALNGAAGNATAGRHGRVSALLAEERECARVRIALRKAITDDAQATAVNAASEFPALRRRYVTQQQAFEACVAPLRARLRARAAAGSPAMARLAAVDAVMEGALGTHERALLAAVPGVLQRRFERLRKQHAELHGPNDEVHPGKWLDDFGRDFHDVLLAELDFRMQPIEGLIGALRNEATRLS